jgi:transcriptional regulator with XRE-family HTH domain
MSHTDLHQLQSEMAREISRLRDASRLSQRELAHRAGLSLDVIQRLEKVDPDSGNDPRLPNLKSVVKVADALGVDFRSLFGEQTSRPRRGRTDVARLAVYLEGQPEAVVQAVETCAHAIARVEATSRR